MERIAFENFLRWTTTAPIEVENSAVAPHVGAVAAHAERNVAHQKNFLLRAILLEPRPLVDAAAAPIYLRLLPQIERIKAFDHHAHPALPDDPDVDAAPPPPGASPLRVRDDNPENVAAAKALFGFPFSDLGGAHAKWLVDRKAALKKQYAGPQYFNYILDRVGIETSMAPRVSGI